MTANQSSQRAAVFRPDDDRMERAVELLDSLGVTPVPDPMLAIEPTGAVPRTDAGIVIFTSRTGIETLPEQWTTDADLVAIGEHTAESLRAAGYTVSRVPEEHSSDGLVDALSPIAAGMRIEIARSDHGSDRLIDGLVAAGAYVHETVLYRLTRPPAAGRSVELAADGALAYALFTSSLTVEYFFDAATARGRRSAVESGLAATTIGAIGEPTAATLREHGIDVDVIPAETSFEALARATIDS